MSKETARKMMKELNKFFKVYNSLAENKVAELTEDIPPEQYSKIIRTIGNYIYMTYNPETWLDSHISFDNTGVGMYIDFSVLKGTRYVESVKNFLSSIKTSFDSNIDQELVAYFLSDQCEFTPEESSLCLTFYQKANNVGNCIRKQSFEYTSLDVMAKDSIAGYAEQSLIPFNELVAGIAKSPRKMRTLERFDFVVKKIAQEKVHPEVFFNDEV